MISAPLRTGLVAMVLAAACTAAQALPNRAMAARPLPPSVLAAAHADSVTTLLTLGDARALADTLLAQVSAIRGLRPLRPVPVVTSSRSQVRTRLEEITRQDNIEARLRQDERLLRYLGLVPADQDLVRTYHDLLAEQLAGFYDIDKRELVFADWLPRDLQRVVATHELTHALQDQHFSLRVRKRLGFESPDAEAAWQALVEGDASAVMAELELQARGKHFTDLADSTTAAANEPMMRGLSGGLDSERFRAAPEAVRGELSFPYVHGLRYVSQLYGDGGWKAVDNAYIHPPVSTEQVLHPQRVQNTKDLPVRIQIPDLTGLLFEPHHLDASGTLGEYDLYLYMKHYVDDEVAKVSSDGWAGCAWALYDAGPGKPPVFLLVSQWDSEDDAVEFYGGLIGTLEARFPHQEGWAEASSQDQIIWGLDKGRDRVNVLRLHERQVICMEALPNDKLMRITQKLDAFVKVEDPSPEVRATQKDQLPWNRVGQPVSASALVPRMVLPEGWTPMAALADSQAVLEAQRGDARLMLAVDREALHDLGNDGYAHLLAERIQKRGKDVYVQTDVDYPRQTDKLYQLVFTQNENKRQRIYYLGVADLIQGFGYLMISGPADVEDKKMHDDFYKLLDTIEFVPSGSGIPQTSAPNGNTAPAPGAR